MSNRELIFGPANFREEEATETAAKLLDLQRIAEKMVSRDKRFDVFDAQKNNPPSLAWSDDNEDGNLRVYAIAKYGRARGKRMKTDRCHFCRPQIQKF